MDDRSSENLEDIAIQQFKMENAQCNPCLLMTKEEKATSYCSECEENLCSNCAGQHGSRKATQGHKLIPIQDKAALVKYCSPCDLSGKKLDATLYCNICDEFLCQDCVNIHRKRKATQEHTPKPFNAFDDPSTANKEPNPPCDICQSNEATNYCLECKQFFCGQCTKIHESGKATKNHKFTEASSIALQQNERQKCQPCQILKKTSDALKYCQDCEEWLCEQCTTVHISQRFSKSHLLKDANDVHQDEPHCDVCVQSNKFSIGQKYCIQCEEVLCDSCVQIHTKQRATKDHNLVKTSEMTNKEETDSRTLCKLCKEKNISETAGYYCNECEYFLCGNCKDRHSNQKNTRKHRVVESSSSTGPKVSNKSKCDLCDDDDEQAESFCKECECNMCRTCKDLHRVQKQTSRHNVVEIEEKSSTKDMENCSPCTRMNKTTLATKFCEDCQEYLCDACRTYHSRLKQTKDHTLKDVDEVKEEPCFCSPCLSSENIEIDAEGFCSECEEFLCSSCINRHKAAKLSRNHKFISVSDGQSRTLGGNVLLCEPCKYLSKSLKAYAFCKECKELLCDLCFKQHPAQKQNRGHQLEPDLSKYSEYIANQLRKEEIEKEERDQPKPITPKEPEKLEQETPKPTDIPGKPRADDIRADSVTIVWDRPGIFDEKNDYYQISYQEKDQGKWKFYPGESDRATKDVTDLKADTQYIFRVRVVHQNGEGQYSEESDVIKTVNSPAANLVNFSTIVKPGKPSPSVYGVPIREVPHARDSVNKTKKFEVGDRSRHPNVTEEKTIMLVGATGTGKSTFVDGLVNYALGVNWNDKFRFTIIDLEEEEKARNKDESMSQTEWITVYTINPEQGGRLHYRLNIIDTPGFGDTRGLKRDEQIVEQIRALFSGKDVKGVQCIDAVCFLIKAPDARLTAVQSYIFQQIMALFGKDVEENICSLITFADGQDPPVLSALSASNLPFGKHFTFNNSGLFAKNTELDNAGLSPMFWDMGIKSFNNFFVHLATMKTKSLQLTKSVLDERKKLETTVQNLQPQVDAGLAKLNMLNEEIKIISQHKLDAESNKDFEYEVEEIEQKRHELPKGTHTTNCLHCNFTCHKSCVYANDDQKKNCSAMDGNGNCTQCTDNCHWTQHANTPYIFEYVSVKKKKTYQEKLQKYQDAEGKRLTHEQVVSKMGEELVELQQGIEDLMQTVKQCNERLGEIALRPNPLSMTEHIDLMIRAEQLEQKAGHVQRIAILEEMKHRALTTKRAEKLFQGINQHSKTFSAKSEDGNGKTKKESKSFSLKKFLGF